MCLFLRVTNTLRINIFFADGFTNGKVVKSILHNVLRMEADIAESERIAVAMVAADIEEYKIILMDAVMPTSVRHPYIHLCTQYYTLKK